MIPSTYITLQTGKKKETYNISPEQVINIYNIIDPDVAFPDENPDAPIKRQYPTQDKKAEVIINEICRHFGKKPEAVKKKCRDKELVYVRHWCIYFLTNRTSLSLKRISELFNNRDHSTPIHARDSVAGQIESRHPNRHKEDYPILLNLFE